MSDRIIKLTSIEWLVEQYKKCGVLTEERVKKAKEIELEQLRKALEYGYERGLEREFTTEQEQHFYQSLKQHKQ